MVFLLLGGDNLDSKILRPGHLTHWRCEPPIVHSRMKPSMPEDQMKDLQRVTYGLGKKEYNILPRLNTPLFPTNRQ